MPTVSELSVEVTANVDQAIANMGQLSNALTVMGGHSQMQAAIFSRAGFLIADIGRSFEQAGKAGLTFFKSSVDLAVEYERSAALTATQARRVGGSLEEVAAIGRRVARDIPAAFAQMQPALYDIFSTTNLGVADAEKALRLFAKAAVAGQVDIRTASRASIDMMNAFGKSTNDLSEILDLQFKLVQVGKGEYKDIAANLGRASSSAVRAGQGMNEFAGVAAFISRFLPSMGNTVASTGRAFDAFSNPKVIERMKDMGVTAVDMAGNFRPISDVMADLGSKMSDLTKPQRAEALKELFKGAGGTIQARRFFDIAIEQFDELNKMTDEVAFGAGSMNQAYQQMFDTNAVKIQNFRNQWDLLRESIGTKLLPSLTPILEFFNGLIDRFNKLSPGMQDAIIKTLVIGSGFTLLTGKVLGLVGSFLRFKAVLLLLGEMGARAKALSALGSGIEVALGGAAKGSTGLLGTLKSIGAFFIGPWGLAILAIAAAAVGIYLLIKNWDKVVEAVKTAWNWLQDIGGKIYDFFAGVFGKVSDTISGWVENVKNFFSGVADAIRGFFGTVGNVLTSIKEGFLSFVEWIKRLPEAILQFIIMLPEKIAYWLGFAIGRLIRWGIDTVQFVMEWGPKIIGAIVSFFVQLPGRIWDFLKMMGERFMEGLTNMWNFATEWVPKIFMAIVDWFSQLPERIWNYIQRIATIWWEGIQKIWNVVQEWVPRIVQGVINFVSSLPERIWNFIRRIPEVFWNGLQEAWRAAVEWGDKIQAAIGRMVEKIWDWIVGLPARLWAKAKSIGESFVRGIKDGLGISSPSLPERYFAAIANAAFNSVDATQLAIRKMKASMGGFAPMSAMLNPPTPSFGAGYSTSPGFPGEGGPSTAPRMVVENMNVTSIRPEEIAKDVAEEVSWSLTVGGK